MEILKSDGTWAEKQPEQWETVETPNTPAQSYNQLDSKPEELAELYNLSSKLGVSQSAVKNNLDVARKAANIPDFEKLQERAPILVGQTKDAWFLGLAQDDLENLATIEERTAALNKQRQQINEGATKQINKLSSSWVPGFIKGTDTFKELVSGQAMDRAGVLWEQRRNLILQGKDLPQDKLEYLAQLDAASSFETTKTGLSSFIPAAGEFAGQMFSGMTSPQVLERGLEGALAGGAVGAAASIPTGGLASPVTATSGAVTGAGVGLRVGYFEHAHDVEAGQAFREFRALKDGQGVQIDDKTAAVAAELVGVVNATLETVGFSAVAKVVPGLRKVMSKGVKGLILANPTVRKAFFDFAKNYAAAWAGEVTTEMAQEMTNIIVGGVLQDQSIMQTVKDPQTAAQLQGIFEKVGKGMAVFGMAGGGVTLAGDIKAAHNAKTEATARKQKFVDFATSAEASRLKERSPEAFGEFMQRVGQKHGVETVLLQADRVVETLVEQQGMAPEEVSAWAQQYGVSQQELATAMQTGGTIELEFGKVAANLGKDETITLFQDDFHLEHGETPINAVADSVQGESQTAVRIKELYEEEQQRLITPDMADQIISDITAQLKDANIKGDNPALSVMPIIARANVLAKLTGTDAAEHLQRFGITIQRQGFDEFAAEHQLDAAQFQVAAWHGSPHDHNKFDSSKIGTGEGAQAYGWGLYFAGKKDVAEWYKDRLSLVGATIIVDGDKSFDPTATGAILRIAENLYPDNQKSDGALSVLDAFRTNGFDWANTKSDIEAWADNSFKREALSVFDDVKERVKVEGFGQGRLYEVELAPNEDELLDWDKPLSEQSDKVREALGVKSEASLKDYYAFLDSLIKKYQTQRFRAKANSKELDTLTMLREKADQNGRQEDMAGSVFYEKTSDKKGSQQAASEYIHSLGIRGIKYLDGSSRSQGEGNYNYVIFDDNDISIKAKFQKPLSRTDAATRGAIISGEGRNLITLFEQANVSTFLHEMGHMFLNDLEYVADKYGVQVDEWNAIKEWLGVDGEITTEQHEQFARGFEAYLREGEAPVAGLRAAFRQFKSWLVKIYRTADALQVDINDDLRRVFDRLVATEEEIQQARELAAQVAILDEKFFSEVGATDAEKEEYRASVNSAEYSATEKKDKQRVGKLDDRLKGFRAQAKEEIKQEPIYKAMDAMVEKGGIDKSSVTRLFGKINLPSVKGLFKKDGLDIEHAAIEAGYESAREFVEAMSKAKTKQQWIEQRVAQLEIEHDQGLTTEEAIRTAQARKQMELESKWLARKEGQQRAALTRRALKVWADQTTAAQKLGDAIKITKLITASRKLRQQVIASIKKGDWTIAFDANEKARLNEALIAAHYRANEAYRKMQTRWKRAVKADVAYEYRQQINQLMIRNQMVSRRLDVNEDTPSLAKFIDDLNANVDEITSLGAPTISENLKTDDRATSEMTWGEIQELDDLLKFLVGRGLEIKKGLLSDEKTAIADLAEKAVVETAKMKGKKIAKHGSLSRKIQDVKESYFASTKLPLWIFRQMDGWAGVSKKSKDGVNVRELWGRLAKSLDALYVAKEDVGKKIQPHLTQLITSWKKNGNEIKTSVPVPDCYKADNRQWTFENVVLMALNIGTADNMQRLSSGFTIDGMPMSESQIIELTSILSVDDWAAIRGILDSVDSLFPQADSVHLKIKHSRMKKVHARPIMVRANDGTEIEHTGGYFPIRYDGSLSFMAGMWDEKSDMLSRQAAVFQTPSAKSGFSKQRTANGAGLPVKLSMSVLSEHLEDVLRFTHLAQAVRDVDRVTQHKTYRNEASRVLGNELYRLIRPSLKHIIRPEKSGGSRWDRTLDSAMKKSSAFYMAWNVVTAVKNFGGFFMALAEVNKVDLAIGYLAFFKNPKDSYDAVLKLSAYMRSRYTQYDKDFKRKMYKFEPEKEILGYSHEDLVSTGYFGIIAADSMVFLPSWLGTFKGEMARNGGDIEQAISAADLKIRTLQPAGNELELSHMQRSTEGLAAVGRLITPFFGFAGNFGNVQRAYVAAFRAGKMPLHEFMTKMFWACLAQPVAPLVLLAYLRTGEPPEPEEIAKEIVGHNVQGFPVVRDVVGYSLGSGYGDAVSTPALEFINIVARLGEDSVDAGANMFSGEFSSEDAGKVIFGLSEIGSYATGVPVSQVYKRLKKGYDQVESGDGTAVNLIFPKRKGE